MTLSTEQNSNNSPSEFNDLHSSGGPLPPLTESERLQIYTDVFQAGIRASDAELVNRASGALIDKPMSAGPALDSTLSVLTEALVGERISRKNFQTQYEDVATGVLVAISQLCSWTNEPEKALPALNHVIHNSEHLSNSEEVVRTALCCIADLYMSCPTARLTDALFSPSSHPLEHFADLQQEVLTDYLSTASYNKELMLYLSSQALQNPEKWRTATVRIFEELGHRANEIKSELSQKLFETDPPDTLSGVGLEAETLLRLIGSIGPEAGDLIDPIIDQFSQYNLERVAPIELCLGKLGGLDAVRKFENARKN